MFSFRPKSKDRKHAEDWYRLGRKVYDYRKDILTAEQRTQLEERLASLRAVLKDKTTSGEDLQRETKQLEPVLKKTGGFYYPRHWLAENIEMILVAGILAIGIRTFFFQPFKIPTNSMFPSYYGMTYELINEENPPQSLPVRLFEIMRVGQRTRTVEAPVSGELMIPVAVASLSHPDQFDPQRLSFRIMNRAPARPNWPVFRGMADTYKVFVDNEEVDVSVPAEFDFDGMLKDWLTSAQVTGEVVQGRYQGRSMWFLKTGLTFEQGEQMFGFRILTGDQLFVDRVSYHFVRPQAGDPFVFLTDNIEHMPKGFQGKYYIKRLAGTPGDTLEIEPPMLIRNGEPADATAAFVRNNSQEGKYSGYVTASSGALYPGTRPIQVPDDHFFALGDNSPNSLDSRYWGFVPAREVVGRAVFIYYPFTTRWGPSD